MTEKIKKFFPDLLINLGVFILSASLFRHTVSTTIGFGRVVSSHVVIEWPKILGLMLIVIGINIIIRKYFRHSKVQI